MRSDQREAKAVSLRLLLLLPGGRLAAQPGFLSSEAKATFGTLFWLIDCFRFRYCYRRTVIKAAGPQHLRRWSQIQKPLNKCLASPKAHAQPLQHADPLSGKRASLFQSVQFYLAPPPCSAPTQPQACRDGGSMRGHH